MAIKSLQIGQAGLSNTQPQWVYIQTTDTLATVTTAGYLNGAAHEWIASLTNNMMAEVIIIPSANANPEVLLMQLSIVNGVYSLVQPYVLNNPVSGQVVSVATSSATPGTIRALTGKMTGTATVETSGNLVGVRGELDVVGASGGFWYGTQGKVIPTGALSGSLWCAGVFGQFDLSHPAVINGAQLATIWGDWGATGGTATSMTGARGYAFTNTTSNILNAQFYMYGPATNLLELDDNQGAYGATYFVNAGTSAGSWGNATPPTPSKVLTITVNGTSYYLPLVAQNT